jgi:hypothetical protein
VTRMVAWGARMPLGAVECQCVRDSLGYIAWPCGPHADFPLPSKWADCPNFRCGRRGNQRDIARHLVSTHQWGAGDVAAYLWIELGLASRTKKPLPPFLGGKNVQKSPPRQCAFDFAGKNEAVK